MQIHSLSSSGGGIGVVELGLLFGQQIAAVQRLEAKLLDTEKMITSMSTANAIGNPMRLSTENVKFIYIHYTDTESSSA